MPLERSSKEQVSMVWHQDKGKDLKAELFDGSFHPFEELAVVMLIAKDLLSHIAARHRVIDCSGVLDAERTRHRHTLAAPALARQDRDGRPCFARVCAHHSESDG